MKVDLFMKFKMTTNTFRIPLVFGVGISLAILVCLYPRHQALPSPSYKGRTAEWWGSEFQKWEGFYGTDPGGPTRPYRKAPLTESVLAYLGMNSDELTPDDYGIFQGDAESLQVLIVLLSHKNVKVKKLSLTCITACGDKAVSALPHLAVLKDDPDMFVRLKVKTLIKNLQKAQAHGEENR